jgi:hypothetical protein
MSRGRQPRSWTCVRHRTKVCEWCGENFKCARFDARTCSNACRLAFARWVRKWSKHFGRKPNFGPLGDASYQRRVRDALPNQKHPTFSNVWR